MFFKRNEGSARTLDQTQVERVYVLQIKLTDDTIIYKVGKTSNNRTVERVLEISRSFFMKYRYFPEIRVRLDMKTPAALLVEKHMHNLLGEYQYLGLDSKVSGYSEMFTDIDETTLLDYMRDFPYNELLQVDSMKTKDYEDITEYLRLELDKGKSKKKSTDELPF